MEAKKLINNKNVLFVDVREIEEYKAGHIPNITNIPLSQFTERVSELNKQQHLVMVCRSGNRSANACEYLTLLEYPNVSNLFGGMNNWVGEIE
jgi:rhodanese-related sulfurtransferase